MNAPPLPHLFQAQWLSGACSATPLLHQCEIKIKNQIKSNKKPHDAPFFKIWFLRFVIQQNLFLIRLSSRSMPRLAKTESQRFVLSGPL